MTDEPAPKLEFFIACTRRDLGQASKKLIEIILEANHIPSGMELYPANIDPLLTDLTKHLEQCDVLIILLGARYGEYVADGETGFTEWEYNHFEESGRPVLVFLLNDDEFEKERSKAISEDPNEKAKEDTLNRFRDELKKSRFCSFFSNTDKGIEELGRLFTNSIHRIINEKRLGGDAGWVRASSQEISTLRLINENPFLDRVLKRMREFSIVGERVTIDKMAKRIQAQLFWETMMGPIRRHGYKNIFIESGSTLAYVSESFENYVLKNDRDVGSWHIWTNNVLTLLQLLLYTDVAVTRFPPSAPDPEDKYGAIFPPEWHSLIERPPKEPRALHEEEAEAVEEMKGKLRKFSKKTLFLATTSGWDLDHQSTDFQGPHVGSHSNMLFKRALFTTEHPVLIFLSAEKLGDPFERDLCYSIFGPGELLTEALEKYPLALCVGYDRKLQSPTRRELDSATRKERNDPNRISNILRELGFDAFYERTMGDIGAIIAGNSAFRELLPNY